MSELIVTNNHHECLDRRRLRSVFLLNFILSMSAALVAYYESPFLSKFFSDYHISWIFAASNLAAALALFNYSKILNATSSYFMSALSLVLYALSLFGLAWTDNPVFIIPVFILFMVSLRLAFLNMDILLEDNCSDSVTGHVRGFFYFTVSIAWMMMPIIGAFLSEINFKYLFIISAMISVGALLIYLFRFRPNGRIIKIEDGFRRTLKQFWVNKPIHQAYTLSFILNAYFSFTSIYVPLYLLKLHYSLADVGLIFTVMLVPYLAEYLFGCMLDRRRAEGALMATGLAFMMIASILMFMAGRQNIIFWAAVLLASRVGCMLLEIATEVYFYKQIDREDVNLINFYRTAATIAPTLIPILGAVILLYFGLSYVFLLSAVLVALGFYVVVTLAPVGKDGGGK